MLASRDQVVTWSHIMPQHGHPDGSQKALTDHPSPNLLANAFILCQGSRPAPDAMHPPSSTTVLFSP